MDEAIVAKAPYDCGGGALPDERPCCCFRGDCSLLGAEVTVAGTAKHICAWVRQTNGGKGTEEGLAEIADAPGGHDCTPPHLQLLSVWGITAPQLRDDGDSMRPLGFGILAHVLLNPQRVIFVRLEEDSDGSRYRFGESMDRTLSFEVLFKFIHRVRIPWETTFEAHINRYTWTVAGWDAVRIGDRVDSCCMWMHARHRNQRIGVESGTRLGQQIFAGRCILARAQACLAARTTARASATKAPQRRSHRRTTSAPATLVTKHRFAKRRPPARLAMPALAITAGPASEPHNEDDIAAAVDADVSAAMAEVVVPNLDVGAPSASSSAAVAPRVIPVRPSRPIPGRATDTGFLLAVLGRERYETMRAGGYMILFDAGRGGAGLRDGEFGAYFARVYTAFRSSGVRRDAEQIPGSRIVLRDADDHARVVRLVYGQVLLYHSTRALCLDDEAAPEAEVIDAASGGSHSEGDTSSESSAALTYVPDDSDVDFL